ncbi:MAG: GNAT family N-acetyltransferase [Candidatus Marinimicrobia bacterium]|jgi:ribosomal protein S18 acetylase RimI-like enzyme|nr:GNAT family N-acetyltransferase [Candidatus Neomarinimicrobiota bacterium]MBT3496054.1 GNAT family N-acetyltransferase [Candidatus Neomarinimicrobiota bacterium]MBT3692833.1 GNAT family N-acetyltransferase [Candidatus Neomarinimicrobiota bacterium]MBT3732183.1 GNAT family N-acetyltransferase [Candidatus Neomarinimicrobiota bacterium]MBT4144848.1 GNAT family N-acetyltransferase [Candidatus Neomarinimicrobiota bacterium]
MIQICEGNFQECVDLSKRIPEFESPYSIEEYKKRCSGTHLTLIAKIGDKNLGFKIAYDQFNDGTFYSWMGGVLPNFRKQGIASQLADYQENWAKENAYSSIRLKTRKKHKAMIAFSLNRGFVITNEIQKWPDKESRLQMEKAL